MAYGLTIEQVRKINHPEPIATAWGSVTSLTEMAEYAMYRVDIHPGASQPLHFFTETWQAYVEAGSLLVRRLDEAGTETAGSLPTGHVLELPQYQVHALASTEGASVYFFGPRTLEGLFFHAAETAEAAAAAFGSLAGGDLSVLGNPTTDVREKYWGRIETIYSGDVAAKRIYANKGGSGSLEFHVEKRETYYIHSGLVKVGLRIGRAENRSIVMAPGDSYDMRPGVMHMREGLEDTVIIEVSTRDSDSDSYLVEDGQTYRHIDIDSQPSSERQEQPA